MPVPWTAGSSGRKIWLEGNRASLFADRKRESLGDRREETGSGTQEERLVSSLNLERNKVTTQAANDAC